MNSHVFTACGPGPQHDEAELLGMLAQYPKSITSLLGFCGWIEQNVFFFLTHRSGFIGIYSQKFCECFQGLFIQCCSLEGASVNKL